MELEIKTWLQDIDRSIQEIYDFIPAKRDFNDFLVNLKQEKLVNEILKLLVKPLIEY